jgi:predicted porin
VSAVAILLPGIAWASEADVLRKIEDLQAEINALKAQVAAKPVAVPTPATDSKSATKDGIEWYGRLDLAAESNDDGTTKRTYLQNISSRIGFKGQRQLSNDLNGLIQVETGIAPDDAGNSKGFASRNSFVGLQGGFGTFVAGTYDTPFKRLDENVSLLWGNADTMEHITHGKANGAMGVNFHTRLKNTFQYWSPKVNGFQAKLAYSPDELEGTYTGATAGSKRSFLGSSIEYNNGSWNVGVATDAKKDPIKLGKDITAIKLLAGMKLNNWTYGGAYSTIDNNDGKKASNWMIAGQYDVGSIALKANFGVAGESSDNAQDGGKMLGLEADYRLNKATTAYAYLANFKADSKAVGFKFDAGDNSTKTLIGNDASVLGVGIRYNF